VNYPASDYPAAAVDLSNYLLQAYLFSILYAKEKKIPILSALTYKLFLLTG